MTKTPLLILRLLPVVVLLALRPVRAAEERQVYLVKDGVPAAVILIPDQSDKWTETAAGWLQEYVEKISGVRLPIVREGQPFTGAVVSVGCTATARKAGVSADGVKYDGCRITEKNGVLFLIGRDDAGEVAGNPYVGARGTCRAVVTFLEEFCGVRWFLPGPQGELVPRRRDVGCTAGVDRSVTPAFVSSSGRYPYGQGTPASIANNFRVAIKGSYGGHSYYRMLPSGVGQYSQGGNYFATHPEYFALIGGKRTGAGNHLCSSHPDVARLLTEGVRREFEKGYDLVAFGQEDGYERCECARCEALDKYRGWGPQQKTPQLGWGEGERGEESWDDFYNRLRENPCERVHLLHKAVVDACRESHPDKMINLLLYGPTMYPSKKFASYGDTVVGEICSADPRVPDAWRGKVAWFTGYFYWFDSTLPMGVDVHAGPREVAEGIRTLRAKGFRGISQYAETNWGFQGPVFYLFGRLLGDPERDPEAVIREYCAGVYGAAGETMRAFFEGLYKIHEKYPLNPGHYGRIPPAGKDGQWLSTTEIYLDLYTPAVLRDLGGLLARAENEADSERARGWLRLTRDHFEFARLLSDALRAHEEWKAAPANAKWRELKSRVEAFDAYRLRIISYPKEYTESWFPGHSEFCNYLTSNAQSEHAVYPFPWDTRKAEALRRGVKGVGIGYDAGSSVRYIREPLTLDFNRPPTP